MKQFDNHYYKNVPDKDESLIPPSTFYCYHHVGELRRFVCPYWDYSATKDKQESGYCHFLEKGDWEFNETNKYTNAKTGEVQTANEIGAPLSLLWDLCKECGKNIDNLYSEEEYQKADEEHKKRIDENYNKSVIEWVKKILPLIENEEHQKQLEEWLVNQS